MCWRSRSRGWLIANWIYPIKAFNAGISPCQKLTGQTFGTENVYYYDQTCRAQCSSVQPTECSFFTQNFDLDKYFRIPGLSTYLIFGLLLSRSDLKKPNCFNFSSFGNFCLKVSPTIKQSNRKRFKENRWKRKSKSWYIEFTPCTALSCTNCCKCRIEVVLTMFIPRLNY